MEAVRNGTKGVISVAANAVPWRFCDLNENAQLGNWQLVVEIDDSLRHLYGILALETNAHSCKMVFIAKGI